MRHLFSEWLTTSAIVFALLGLPLTAHGEPIRDQGQIFGTDGELQLGTDEWSQSITTGISGQLAEIDIQFRLPTQPTALNLSIFDGGNPISGSALFSEQLTLTSADLDGENVFTWDLSSANFFFDVGDVFSFVLQADAAGYDIAGNDPPGYDDGDLFRNRVAFPELSDIAFITYVKPSSLNFPAANLTISIDQASSTWPAGFLAGGQSPEFASFTNNPLGPFSGVPVTFRGVFHGGNELIYRYRLDYDREVTIDSVAVQGAAWAGDIIRLLDAEKNVLGSVDASAGSLDFQPVVLPVSNAVGRVFFLEEFNTDTHWRYRSSIHVNLAPIPTVSIDMEIDIKPGSNENPVNPHSKGNIPVAVLTTDDFDASTVDANSVRFGSSAAQPVKYRLDDVDDDGDYDLALKFSTQETGITCGDTSATLTGETFDGQSFIGTDSIKTVGCKSKNLL